MPKRSGGARTIDAPHPRLRDVQRRLLTLLEEVARPATCAHGFIKNRDIISNAKEHIGRRYILNIDIENFFGTITTRRLRGALWALYIQPDISTLIARICTLSAGHLPQGAPTSPIASNLVCWNLDKALMVYAKTHNLRYTRYADDITLSSFSKNPPISLGQHSRPGRSHIINLPPDLVDIFHKNDFNINENKVFFQNTQSRKSVTGLVVNEKINIPRTYVRNTKSALFSAKANLPLARHNLKEKYGKTARLEHYIRGRINHIGHVKGIDNNTYVGLAKRFNSTFPAEKPIKYWAEDEFYPAAIWIVESTSSTDSKFCEQGTAFFLKGVGLVTNAHCVTGATDISVYSCVNPFLFPARILRISEHHDLCVLAHSIPKERYAELERGPSSPLKIGTPCTVRGFHDYSKGDRLTVRSGVIESTTTKSLVEKAVCSFPISDGMSGGPILNEAREVIAVGQWGGSGVQRNLAIHIKHLDNLK